MRETEPLAVFAPWAEAIIKAQPSLAFIHAVEPRIAGGSDSPDKILEENENLAPIRKIIGSSEIKFIVAGGYTPETAVMHAAQTDDLVAFGRFFIRKLCDQIPPKNVLN